jgi:hypothetical protein
MPLSISPTAQHTNPEMHHTLPHPVTVIAQSVRDGHVAKAVCKQMKSCRYSQAHKSKQRFFTQAAAETSGQRAYCCDGCGWWFRTGPVQPLANPVLQQDFPFPYERLGKPGTIGNGS